MRYVKVCRVGAWSLVVLAAIIICSCSDEPCKPCGDGQASRATVGGLLDLFADSFDDKDVATYGECLDESFEFEFVGEIAEWLGLPSWHAWWGKEDEMTAMSNLFTSLDVGDIQFDYTLVTPPQPMASGDPAYILVRMQIDLKLTVEMSGEEPTTYWVNSSYLDLTVAPDPENDTLYIITDMKEILIDAPLARACEPGMDMSFVGALASERSSLSGIKAMFFEGTASLRRTVAGLLDAYTGSCEARSIGVYAECLDDDHKFVFTDEVADSLDLPAAEPWWFKTEDVNAMSNMFESADVTSIEFHLEILSQETVEQDGDVMVKLRTEPEIWVIIERAGEEPLALLVNSTYLDFDIIQDPHNAHLLTMLEIREIEKSPFPGGEKGGSYLVESPSFGHIKAMFR